MIKAQELRIGNWYNDKRIDRDFVVHGINQRSIDHGDSDYSPTSIANAIGITLTSEWLERFGFEDITKEWQTDKCFRTLSKAGTKIDYWLSEQAIYRNEDHFLTHVYYVHQLQNLYFALTGSDLQL